MFKRLQHTWAYLGATAAVAITPPGLAWAAVPAPPAPSTAPASNDAIKWFEGVFEDASEVGILIVGVILFVIGAVGMIWAVTQVLGNRATIGEVAKIGLASAAGIAFGTYALTQATAVI